MKKRVLSILLIITMTICLMPSVVMADQPASQENLQEEADLQDTTGMAEQGKEFTFIDDSGLQFKPLYRARVNFTSQMSGSFLHAPKFSYSVASNLAESYGYTDAVNGVSVLDVLVAAHKLVYGSSFTKATANNYLTVADNRVTMQFGSTARPEFFLNHGKANTGVQSSSGLYTPTEVGTQIVHDGDLIEFFFLEDADYADMYNWFTDMNGQYSRSLTVNTGDIFDLTLKGYHVYNAVQCKNAEAMVNSNAASSVSRAQVYTVDPGTGSLTAVPGAVTNSAGKCTLCFDAPGEYWITAGSIAGCTFRQVLTLTKVTAVEPQPVTAAVDFTSQMSGQFLHAPQFGKVISSDLAESYGYADDCEGVSVLDVLVAAHELAYGSAFTGATAQNYLVINNGIVSKQFGNTLSPVFFVNHGFGSGGINVMQEVKDGDLVEFFFMEDNTPGDMYNWFVGFDGEYTRTITVSAGDYIDLILKGYHVYSGFDSMTEEEMIHAAGVQNVRQTQLYLTDIQTGALTPISGARTNNRGEVELCFDEPGEYWITAYSNNIGFTQVLTLTKIVVEGDEPVTAAVDFTSQRSGSFLHAPKLGYEVSSDLAESYGYSDEVNGVSALDVLVAAHQLVYGNDFNAGTAQNYLTLSGNTVTKQFGYSGVCRFFLNHALANDGTMNQNGIYNETGIRAQEVKDGDLVEFFFLEDNTPGDIYNWFTSSGGKYSRSFTTFRGLNLKLILKGYHAYYAPFCENEAAMVNSPSADVVKGVQIYKVNMTTGALTPLSGAVTNNKGEVTIRFNTVGTYYVAAYGTAGLGNTQILTLTKIKVDKLQKIDWGDKPIIGPIVFGNDARPVFR